MAKYKCHHCIRGKSAFIFLLFIFDEACNLLFCNRHLPHSVYHDTLVAFSGIIYVFSLTSAPSTTCILQCADFAYSFFFGMSVDHNSQSCVWSTLGENLETSEANLTTKNFLSTTIWIALRHRNFDHLALTPLRPTQLFDEAS